MPKINHNVEIPVNHIHLSGNDVLDVTVQPTPDRDSSYTIRVEAGIYKAFDVNVFNHKGEKVYQTVSVKMLENYIAKLPESEQETARRLLGLDAVSVDSD